MKYNGHFILSAVCFFTCGCNGCNDTYKAGNRGVLIDLQIKSNVDQDIVINYIDSFYNEKDNPFILPKTFDFLRNGGDLGYFPENNKVVYFNTHPIEAYHLTSNGVFEIAEVFNPSINSRQWITDKTQLNEIDYYRIERRLDTLLNEIVKKAKVNNVPDSVIFWRRPYNKVTCKLARPK